MGITIAAMSTRIAAIAARSMITDLISRSDEHFHSKFINHSISSPVRTHMPFSHSCTNRATQIK